MQTRFKKNAKVFDIGITAVAGMVSVGVMLYAVPRLPLYLSKCSQAPLLPGQVLQAPLYLSKCSQAPLYLSTCS